ncbi:HlyD family efflux transporter periplasmic adaptor subunit [Uruburuella testudinis]|uniref:HlyD family efflux transporter periplasmic adaptor subunit n=1 Tax=Uruburuella testudinis TaxID=1282863 RepID=A0ABY4DXM0_9NEIS|nr:HlyD family efflux transporter periplasmic adaptor subunit [Uruburuella testudinis]UOO83218.1 HlyD family efflux transporter periplasmic adaptor subunit [Uruburuella testudinis]
MSETPEHFFRPEVFEAKKHKWTGRIVLTRPFSFVFLSWCAAIVAALIVIFAVFGSYTRKTTVEGQLLPVSGLVKVYAPDMGIISEKKFADGDFVRQGDELFTLSTSRYNGSGDIQQRLAAEAALKKTLLLQEIGQVQRVHEGDGRVLRSSLVKLQSQLGDVRKQLAGQVRRVKLAEQVVEKYRPLLQQGFISEQQMMGYEGDYLDQLSRLDALRREETGIEREIGEQQISLKNLPQRQQTELSQLNRAIASINQEMLDWDLKQRQSIRASKSGYVSTSNVEVGQQVDPSRLLLSIVPEDAELVANLYVPSRAIGFIKPDDKVVLRYQAYPYQKFGHAGGKVVSIAKTALGKQELAGLGVIFTDAALLNEPAYLIKVKLDKQSIQVYGEEKPLQIGMVVEADVLHERKKLYEWVLDPLYSVSGKLN